MSQTDRKALQPPSRKAPRKTRCAHRQSMHAKQACPLYCCRPLPTCHGLAGGGAGCHSSVEHHHIQPALHLALVADLKKAGGINTGPTLEQQHHHIQPALHLVLVADLDREASRRNLLSMETSITSSQRSTSRWLPTWEGTKKRAGSMSMTAPISRQPHAAIRPQAAKAPGFVSCKPSVLNSRRVFLAKPTLALPQAAPAAAGRCQTRPACGTGSARPASPSPPPQWPGARHPPRQ